MINWAAASAFAVLLLHLHPSWGYNKIFKLIYENYSGAACILPTAFYLAFTYLTAVCIDQARKFLYRKLF